MSENTTTDIAQQASTELEPAAELTLAHIVAQLDDGGDINVVTGVVIASILDEHLDLAAQWLRSPVRDYIRRARRAAARRAEDEAFGPNPPSLQPPKPEGQPSGNDQHGEDQPAEPGAPQPGAPDPLAPLRPLRNVPFWVPGDAMVTWGQGTDEQHAARATWLREHAGKLTADAVRHEYTVDVLHQFGATRLEDIEGF